jgi:hypothetical protein
VPNRTVADGGVRDNEFAFVILAAGRRQDFTWSGFSAASG